MQIEQQRKCCLSWNGAFKCTQYMHTAAFLARKNINLYIICIYIYMHTYCKRMSNKENSRLMAHALQNVYSLNTHIHTRTGTRRRPQSRQRRLQLVAFRTGSLWYVKAALCAGVRSKSCGAYRFSRSYLVEFVSADEIGWQDKETDVGLVWGTRFRCVQVSTALCLLVLSCVSIVGFGKP